MRKKIAIVILTFNSEKTIKKTILASKQITKNIIIVDSNSNDKTILICKKMKCSVLSRKFKNYSDQRNWIIKKINKKYFWQLHLDADEELDDKLIKSINKVINNKNVHKKVFLIRRKYYFLGKKLEYPGLNEWHLRLFQSSSVTCEKRLYDQHFLSKFKVNKINDGFIHDNDKLNLIQWKKKHVRWAELESKDIFYKNVLKNEFSKKNDPRYKFRNSKLLYYNFPKYFRVLVYFFYRYIFKLGFMDGKYGILFCFYQAFWFRFIIDYKINILEKNKHL